MEALTGRDTDRAVISVQRPCNRFTIHSSRQLKRWIWSREGLYQMTLECFFNYDFGRSRYSSRCTFPDKEQEIRSGSKRCLGAHTSKMQIYNHQLEQPALSHRWILRRKLSIWPKVRLYHVCSYLVETTEETKNWEESISPSLGWSIEKMRTWNSAPIQYFVRDRRRNLATWQCILNVIGAGGKPGTVWM